MRVWRRSPNPTIRHLLALGCSADQVRRHMARGREPVPVIRPRPRLDAWWSWASRIQHADRRGWGDAEVPGELK
jgi:hypothetical protein